MKPSALFALIAMSLGSGGGRAIEHPREPHYGTPKRDPSRRRMPLAKRRHGPKSMPPGYHAQTVPLKHMHGQARFRRMVAEGIGRDGVPFTKESEAGL